MATVSAPQKKATDRKPAAYRYLATNSQGRQIKGTIKAAGEIEAERLLINKGYSPINVELVPSMLSWEEALPSLFRCPPSVIDFLGRPRQFSPVLSQVRTSP